MKFTEKERAWKWSICVNKVKSYFCSLPLTFRLKQPNTFRMYLHIRRICISVSSMRLKEGKKTHKIHLLPS